MSFVIQPPKPKTRKAIIATSIAVSDFYIDGIVYVVDSGLERLERFDSNTCNDGLFIAPSTKCTSIQRASHAGYTRPGKCFRLYTSRESMINLNRELNPIESGDLTSIVLRLKSIGIKNLLQFDFITTPSFDQLEHALNTLVDLSLMNDSGALNANADMVAGLPMDVYLGTMILNSYIFECVEEIVTIVSMLMVNSVFAVAATQIREAKAQFAVEEGDMLSLVNVFQGFVSSRRSSAWCTSLYLDHRALNRVYSIRQDIFKVLKSFNKNITSCGTDTAKVQRCILSVYHCHVAKLEADGTYSSTKGQRNLYIHPSSVLYNVNPKWIVYRQGNCYFN
jgi:ATP-dependent RNA helicase DDX35